MINPIRVLVVDDHDMLRTSLVYALDGYDGLRVVGEAANGEEAVRLCGLLQPDVVLLDLMMPVMNGVAASQIIARDYPEVRIIVLTSTTDIQLLDSVLETGVVMCLFKNVSVAALVEAIESTYERSRGKA
jgi:DNA-binding NarL/FixJ family response regulator